MCSGSVVVTAYDFESDCPGSSPEWGLIYYKASISAQGLPEPSSPGVVHWISLLEFDRTNENLCICYYGETCVIPNVNLIFWTKKGKGI